jgi:hypothetical protein
MGDRRVLGSLGEVIAGVPLFVGAPLVRTRHLRWGATDAEVRGPMPGDEIVPAASFSATRAITIAAPPERVWPWIVQVGFGRAGFYSYDLLDNLGRSSADCILPDCQAVQVGDWVPMASKINETTAFKVKAFESNQWLIWDKPDSTWVWKLEPLTGGRTRLITRLKQYYDWKSPAGTVLTLILAEFGDFAMMRKMLLGIKARAEKM